MNDFRGAQIVEASSQFRHRLKNEQNQNEPSKIENIWKKTRARPSIENNSLCNAMHSV